MDVHTCFYCGMYFNCSSYETDDLQCVCWNVDKREYYCSDFCYHNVVDNGFKTKKKKKIVFARRKKKDGLRNNTIVFE